MTKHIQAMAGPWSKLLVIFLVAEMSITQILGSDMVQITLLNSALAKGAVCLDGSPPAYYYAPGFGKGVNNWLVHLEGGGWCATDEGCYYRKTQHTGSSKYKNKVTHFGQILSEVQAVNPDFYDWNRVYVGYCDSSSYMGDVEEINPVYNITRRGARIFDAIMQDLLAKGMKKASMAILSGESAGGLGAIFHCDGFRALLPSANRVKCISDAGFFLHAKNLNGADIRAHYYAQMVEYHGITKFLPASCTSRMNASLCIFPENMVKDIRTPLFLLQSAFDYYQLAKNHFSEDQHFSMNCCANLKACNSSELQIMHDFGTATINEMQKISSSSMTGIFIHSCYCHGQFFVRDGWDKSPILGNKNIAKAIGDWYFDRSSTQEIDNQITSPQNCTLTRSLVF